MADAPDEKTLICAAVPEGYHNSFSVLDLIPGWELVSGGSELVPNEERERG